MPHHSLTAIVKTWERTANSCRTVCGATSLSLASRYVAMSFTWMEARERFAREERFQILIRMDSCLAPFLAGITSRSYRLRASSRVVLSASFLETKIPWAISDSMVVAQASVRLCVEGPLRRTQTGIAELLPEALWQRCYVHYLRQGIKTHESYSTSITIIHYLNKIKNRKESRLTIILRSRCAKIVPKKSVNDHTGHRHTWGQTPYPRFDIMGSREVCFKVLSMRSSRSIICSISDRNSTP